MPYSLIYKLLVNRSTHVIFPIRFANSTPHGLEDVSKYPTLFAELIGVGWTIDELTKLAGANLLRVLNEAEAVRDKLQKENVKPIEDIFANRVENPHKCQSV